MTTKDQVIDLVQHLPDDVSVSEIMTCLSSVAEIIQADREIDQGLGEDHEDVMARLRARYA